MSINTNSSDPVSHMLPLFPWREVGEEELLVFVKSLLCTNTVRCFLCYVSFNHYINSYSKEDAFEETWLPVHA